MSVEQEIAYRAQIVLSALGWVGTPYAHQMSTKGQGTDCLGLIRGVWREIVGAEPTTIPSYRADWSDRDEGLAEAARRFLAEKPVGDLQPGDVMLFRMRRGAAVRHCGIYLGEGRFLHAYDGRCVSGAWYSPFWQTRCAGVFAFPYKDKRGTA